MSKDRVDLPEDINEIRELRRDRMAIYMALRHQDLDYVNNMLVENIETRPIINLLTLIETVHPAKEHVEKWKIAFDKLIERLVADGYSEKLIDHVKKTLV